MTATILFHALLEYALWLTVSAGAVAWWAMAWQSLCGEPIRSTLPPAGQDGDGENE